MSALMVSDWTTYRKLLKRNILVDLIAI